MKERRMRMFLRLNRAPKQQKRRGKVSITNTIECDGLGRTGWIITTCHCDNIVVSYRIVVRQLFAELIYEPPQNGIR